MTLAWVIHLGDSFHDQITSFPDQKKDKKQPSLNFDLLPNVCHGPYLVQSPQYLQGKLVWNYQHSLSWWGTLWLVGCSSAKLFHCCCVGRPLASLLCNKSLEKLPALAYSSRNQEICIWLICIIQSCQESCFIEVKQESDHHHEADCDLKSKSRNQLGPFTPGAWTVVFVCHPINSGYRPFTFYTSPHFSKLWRLKCTLSGPIQLFARQKNYRNGHTRWD